MESHPSVVSNRYWPWWGLKLVRLIDDFGWSPLIVKELFGQRKEPCRQILLEQSMREAQLYSHVHASILPGLARSLHHGGRGLVVTFSYSTA